MRTMMETVSVPGDVAALALRLALATVLGAAVGLNREISLKPAGLRTHALVALGAALLTYVGLQIGQAAGDLAAASRVVQGLVAGIGFVGGGVILHRAEAQTVQGLTTAASIWIVAATGVAVGAGLWRAATIAIVLTLVVLTIGHSIDNALHNARGPDRD
jgi:putative Mg2+ transporter-C (MgtC) family protein